jgi:hypothetical protein
MNPKMVIDISEGPIEHIHLKMNQQALVCLIDDLQSIVDQNVRKSNQTIELADHYCQTGLTVEIRDQVDDLMHWEEKSGDSKDHILLHIMYVFCIITVLFFAIKGAYITLNNFFNG